MRKTVIIGAGHVGSHVGYALAASGVCEEIVLVDILEEKAAAQALDIADSVSFFKRDVTVRSGGYGDCADAAVIVIAIGEPRKPGQTRLDLLESSTIMLKGLLKEMKKYPIPGIVITITNPADIVADYVRRGLGLERSRVFGTGTLLDTARLTRALSEATGVSRSAIMAYSMGEHGDSSMIPFTAITIGGLPFSYYENASFDAAEKNDKENKKDYEVPGGISKEKILAQTRQSGMTIIEGKNSTEFGIGRALAEMAACIFRDEKKILPASVLLEGEYGETEVHCGVPCLIGKNGIEKIIELSLDEEEQKMLHQSCEVIRKHIHIAEQV